MRHELTLYSFTVHIKYMFCIFAYFMVYMLQNVKKFKNMISILDTKVTVLYF